MGEHLNLMAVHVRTVAQRAGAEAAAGATRDLRRQIYSPSGDSAAACVVWTSSSPPTASGHR